MLRVRDKGGRNSGEEPVEYRPKSIAISPRPRCTMTVIPKPWHRNNCSLSSAGLLYKPITNVFVESVPIAVTNGQEDVPLDDDTGLVHLDDGVKIDDVRPMDAHEKGRQTVEQVL